MVYWVHKFRIGLAVSVCLLFCNQLVSSVDNVRSSDREPAFRDNFYDVAMRGDDAWIVGYYGTILRSRDAGVTWELQQSGTIEPLFRLSFIDEKHGWVTGSYGIILHTRDGGTSWQRQKAPVEEHLFGLNFIDGRQGWAVGSRGTVLKTEDGGLTWLDYSIGEDVILNDVRFVDAQHGWAVGEFGRIYRSKDGGRTWHKLKSPIEVPVASGESRNLFRLLMTNARSGWAFGLDGVILSTDNGEQWTVSSGIAPFTPTAKRFHLFSASAVGDRMWAVGERGTVLMSSIDHHDWKPAGLQAPPSSLNGISFGSDEVGLIVGNRGIILRSDNAGMQWRQISLASRQS